MKQQAGPQVPGRTTWTMTTSDYGPVADLYDAYVRVEFDLDFFAERARRRSGALLDLMAGTGRVSRVLWRGDRRLTCVDRSLKMLRVLRRRFRDRKPGPEIVCADIRALPLAADHYALAVIPFNSFAELTSPEDRSRALHEVRDVLAPGGRLICTLHNPAIRMRTLDGEPRLLGRYELPRRRKLEVRVRGSLDARTGLARSEQRLRVYGSGGELDEERVQVVDFALITQADFLSLAGAEGFETEELLGDYDGSAFRPGTSPYMIWTLVKA